ncbi:alpha/beta fold hydrolase [Thalassolituus marinus]|uniref:Alpha/beta fold hydrolase n=1 Tax=Thalassolituus marinus TaxID=671053 RepID=A0ABS7ZV53_9GAMM|nr:alpha/beta fold hydrolase [Thalassolituus marinus]MCA6064291.1 alpha/beta fold hydrolase [Thalassolituus marinus]
MKKILLLAIPMVAALAFGIIRGNYAEVGGWIYHQAMATEASLYGFKEHQADIGDMTLSYYRNENPGKPVVVMLHGYSADKTVWLRFARHLTSDYDIIIPDMAGHGESPYSEEWSYGMPAQADRLSRLLKTLDVAAAHVIGNSMGGFLTATFAINYPQNTLSATMIDPAGVMSPEPSMMMKMLAEGRNPFIIHNRKEFDQFYAMTMEQPPIVPDIVLEAVGKKYESRREQLKKIFEDFHSSDYLEERLSELKAPAMLWWGDQDKLLHVSSVGVWQAGVPDLKVHVFEGIGHMPMVEMPGETADMYMAFLSDL